MLRLTVTMPALSFSFLVSAACRDTAPLEMLGRREEYTYASTESLVGEQHAGACTGRRARAIETAGRLIHFDREIWAPRRGL